MAEVLQCDRDAAAQWCYSQPFPSKQAEAPAIEAGEYDHHSLVQAFAAVREAAERAERQAVVEWLAKDANQTQEEAKRIIMNSHGLSMRDKQDWTNLVATKRGIAQAIERGEHRKG